MEYFITFRKRRPPLLSSRPNDRQKPAEATLDSSPGRVLRRRRISLRHRVARHVDEISSQSHLRILRQNKDTQDSITWERTRGWPNERLNDFWAVADEGSPLWKNCGDDFSLSSRFTVLHPTKCAVTLVLCPKTLWCNFLTVSEVLQICLLTSQLKCNLKWRTY